MNIISTLQKIIGGQKRTVITVKCAGFRCNNIFTLPHTITALPDQPICPTCEERFNRGIQEYVHAHSGHVEGNYHLIDGWDRG